MRINDTVQKYDALNNLAFQATTGELHFGTSAFMEFALKGHNVPASPYDNFLPIKLYLKKCNISDEFQNFHHPEYLRTSVCIQQLSTTSLYIGHMENYDKVKFVEMTIQFLFEELLVESAVISVKQRVYTSSMQKYFEISTMKNYTEGEVFRSSGINTKLSGHSNVLNDTPEGLSRPVLYCICTFLKFFFLLIF